MRLAVGAFCIATGAAAGVPQSTQYLAPPPVPSTVAPAPPPIPTAIYGASGRECTVNVPAADLYWWYSAIYTVQTIVYQGLFDQSDTSITAYSSVSFADQPSTYNVASLVHQATSFAYVTSDPAFTITGVTTFPPIAFTTYSYYNTSAPIAPHTTVLELHDHKSAPDVFPASQLPGYSIKLGPASTTVNTFTATSAAPFVRYHNYEVAYPQSTVTVSLASDYAYTIPPVDFNDISRTHGSVPTAFVRSIPENDCVAGTWTAKPTVIIVVIESWGLIAVKPAHVEVSQASLYIPGPLVTPPAAGGLSSSSGQSFSNQDQSGLADIDTDIGTASGSAAIIDAGSYSRTAGSSSGNLNVGSNGQSAGQSAAEPTNSQSASSSGTGGSSNGATSSASGDSSSGSGPFSSGTSGDSQSSSNPSGGSQPNDNPSGGSQSSGSSTGGSQSSGSSSSSGSNSSSSAQPGQQSSEQGSPRTSFPNHSGTPADQPQGHGTSSPSNLPTATSTSPAVRLAASAVHAQLISCALAWATLFTSAWHLF